MFKTNDININGSIGYTLLENGKNKVLILSDMHSELPYCEKNGIFVSDWMKSKTKSKILLEEVPRTDSTLKELWPSSPHTQKLKELFLSNSIVTFDKTKKIMEEFSKVISVPVWLIGIDVK